MRLRTWNGAHNDHVRHGVYTLSCWFILFWCTGACDGVHLLSWVCFHVNGAIGVCNDFGALQPVRSRHLLLGQWYATDAMRHYCGPLLSGWHNKRIWHSLPRGQLLCRRGSKRGYGFARGRCVFTLRKTMCDGTDTLALICMFAAACSRVYLQPWLR